MAAPYVRFAGQNNPAAERGQRPGRTPCIWKTFAEAMVYEDSSFGEFVHENFMLWVGGAVASNLGNYTAQQTAWHTREGAATAGSVATLATDFPTANTLGLVGSPLGAIELATGAAAHNSTMMEMGGGANGATANGMYGVGSTTAATAPGAGTLPALYFEARVRFPQSTNASHFIGMCAPNKTSAANGIFAVGDTFVNMNFIGFVVNAVASTGLATSATKIQPGYGVAANNPQIANQTNFTGNVGGIPGSADYAANTLITPAIAGLTTDFTKLGFLFDPRSPDQVVLKFYQDGVFLAGQTLTQIVAANWPSAVQLTPALYVQSTGAGGATAKLDVDWVDIGQLINVG